jgi:hypothetical protein
MLVPGWASAERSAKYGIIQYNDQAIPIVHRAETGWTRHKRNQPAHERAAGAERG